MFPQTFRQPRNDAFSASTTLTRTAGRHLVKVGGEARAYQFFRIDNASSNGVFGFSGLFTRRDPLSGTGAASGSGFATFLLGLPTSGNVTTGTPRTEQYRYYAVYVQDDWKINARATLNMGLRWDYQPPVTVQDDLTVSAFDDATTNPLQSQLPQGAATINPATGQPMTLIGGLEFANRGGPSRRTRVTGTTSSRAWASVQDQQLAHRAEQLRPVVSRAFERGPGWGLHDGLPADDAVHRHSAERD